MFDQQTVILPDIYFTLNFSYQNSVVKAGKLTFNSLLNMYYFTLFFLVAIVLICHRLVHSLVGRTFIAISHNENLAESLGIHTMRKKLLSFTISAIFAGVAGALYVPQVGIINPGEFDPGNSIEVVIWTAVGGRGTLVGPIVGALIVNAGKSWFTGVLPEYWLFALGGLFVAVTLVLPKGLAGLVVAIARRPRATSPLPRATEAAESPGAKPSPSSISTAFLFPSMASRRSRTCRWRSIPARCAPSSARTAPARRR